MKHIIFFLLISATTQAQKKKAISVTTLTTKQLTTITNKMTERIDLLFWENKRLKERLDSAAYLGDDFIYDSVAKTYSINPEAFVLTKRPKELIGVKPFNLSMGDHSDQGPATAIHVDCKRVTDKDTAKIKKSKKDVLILGDPDDSVGGSFQIKINRIIDEDTALHVLQSNEIAPGVFWGLTAEQQQELSRTISSKEAIERAIQTVDSINKVTPSYFKKIIRPTLVFDTGVINVPLVLPFIPNDHFGTANIGHNYYYENPYTLTVRRGHIAPYTQTLEWSEPAFAKTYIFETDKPKHEQDIADLKWQIEYFEKLLDDDKKIMDKLHKIIDAQQKEIEKLKKKH